MGYQIFQETALKAKLAGAYLSKVIEFTIIIQVFIFSFYFTQVLKKEGFNPAIYAKSFFHKNLNKDEKHHEDLLVQNYQLPLIYSSAIWFLPFFIFLIFKQKQKNKEKKEHRGAKLISVKDLVKGLKDYRNKYLTIGGYGVKTHILTEEDDINYKRHKEQELDYRKYTIEIPEKFEVSHFAIAGRSGSGKTSLIFPLLDQLISRGDRMIIHDYKQDIFKNFYTPDMYLFNPAISGICIKWSIYNDIYNHEDIIAVAHSLIPASGGTEDPYWRNASRDILIACLIYLATIEQTSNKAIYHLVNCPNAEIQEYLLSVDTTIKYTHVFDKSNARTLNGVMSVFRSYIRVFDYLKDIDGSFSVKKWAQNGASTIIIMNDEGVKDAIAPALTLFIDLISRALLTQEDREDRTVFMLDEFGRLNRLNSIVDLLTNGRSKGASVYVAAQEFAQIDEKYSKNTRRTIINACSNQIYLGVNDPVSAQEFSDQIGDSETLMKDESINHKTDGDDMDSINVRNHLQVKKVVLASQIMNLKEREFYIKIANQNWAKSKVYVQKKEEKDEQ